MVSMRKTQEKMNASICGHGSYSKEVRQSDRHLPRLSGQQSVLPSPGNNDEEDKDEPVIINNADATLSFDDDQESCGGDLSCACWMLLLPILGPKCRVW